MAARRSTPLPGYEARHKNCANCLVYAGRWRHRLVARPARTPHQPELTGRRDIRPGLPGPTPLATDRPGVQADRLSRSAATAAADDLVGRPPPKANNDDTCCPTPWTPLPVLRQRWCLWRRRRWRRLLLSRMLRHLVPRPHRQGGLHPTRQLVAASEGVVAPARIPPPGQPGRAVSASRAEREATRANQQEHDQRATADGHALVWCLGENATRRGHAYFLVGECGHCGAVVTVGASVLSR